MRLRFVHFLLFAGAVLAGTAGAFAQAQAPPPPPGDAAAAGPGRGRGFHRGGPFEFGGFEMGLGGKLVKGAPYSAQVVTETNQTLGDGNHIHRQSTSAVYRDSAGRTRREMSLPALSSLTGSGQAPSAIFINDPVASYHYMLHAREKAAYRMPLPPPGSAWEGGHNRNSARGSKHGAQVTEESLGTQSIEGLQAEGTRTTKVIPAGQIGNDRPIQIVIERWYSPDLQTVIQSKHSDPWMGETTFRLTNISRSEPASTLFQVPADYAVKDRPAPRGPHGGRAPNPAPND